MKEKIETYVKAQFILVSKLNGARVNPTFKIYRLDDLSQPIYEKTEEDTNEDFENFIVNGFFYIETDDSLVFILVGQISHIHIIIPNDGSPPVINSYYADLFERAQNPMIQVQKVGISKDEIYGEGQEEVQQYFFFNHLHKVQLLYPNYKLKVTKNYIIDKLEQEGGVPNPIKQTESKKIFCQVYNMEYCADKYKPMMNICRKYSSLNCILNLQNQQAINYYHNLLFVKDIDEQILFITESKGNYIRSYFYQDQHCEECFKRKQEFYARLEQQNALKGLMSKQLTKMMTTKPKTNKKKKEMFK